MLDMRDLFGDHNTELIQGFFEICKENDIEYEFKINEDYGHGHPQESPFELIVKIKDGRNYRNIVCYEFRKVAELIGSQIWKYKFIPGYMGIVNYEENIIECVMYTKKLGGERLISKIRNHSFSSTTNDDSFSIGDCTAAISKMCHSTRSISLKISATKIKNGAHAKSILENISNSVFFQIDILTGCKFMLAKEGKYIMSVNHANPIEIDDMKYPLYEYDSDPMKMYWNAANKNNNVLIRYLSLYQILEHYFYAYKDAEINRRLQQAIKNPSFNPDKTNEIGKLISIMSDGQERSNEIEMLTSTIKECISASSLSTFLSKDAISGKGNKFDFFKVKLNKITNICLSGQISEDHRKSVANRVYNIRCKIVHTKTSFGKDSNSYILPSDINSTELSEDISILQFLAQQVLIKNSVSLKRG